MYILLGALAGVSVVELGLWLPAVWRMRKVAGLTLALVVLALVLALLAAHPTVWTALLAYVGLYRTFNAARIAKGRRHEVYLYRTTHTTALVLGLFQLLIVTVWFISTQTGASWHIWAVVVSVGVLTSLVVLTLSTKRQLRKTTLPPVELSFTDKELPSLTVAIPARNETDDLESCLRSLIHSNYPKLEILVLDDCSQNTRTPEIIRSFAHDGVRFIQGAEPSDTWLAKNHAYQRLFEESSGELLLFCGVDTRFEPGTLRALVTTMLKKRKKMVSIMPDNDLAAIDRRFGTSLIQPMRYAWEIALPRRLLNRPPVLSTCWIIYRDLMAKAGAFAATSRMIVPESYFARQAIKTDGYSFLRSNEDVPIKSVKSISEQHDTAVRTRYPQLHRRPEQVCLVSAIELTVMAAPFVLAIIAFVQDYGWWLRIINLVSIVLLLYGYARITALTYRKFILSSVGAAPTALFYDVVLLNYSMWRYEFSDVLWKGRNVCVPVMHVEPSLPKLENL